MRSLLAIVLLVAVLGACTTAQRLGYLRVPVADLRSTPTPLGMSFAHSADEQSQLLWLDPVEIATDEPLSSLSWVPVNALRQPTVNSSSSTWAPYPGYVQVDQIEEFSGLLKGFPLSSPNLAVTVPWTSIFAKPCHLEGCLPEDQLLSASFGTLLYTLNDSASQGWWEIWSPTAGNRAWVLAAEVTQLAVAPSEDYIRAQLPLRANWLLGYLYFWGGRSAFSLPMYSAGTQLTGFDCSGLVGTLYQSLGLILPRDASKQSLAATPVDTIQDLQVGDLFFYADSSSGFVYHVMMYYSVDPPSLVESSTNSTRIRTLEQAFGVPYEKLTYGMQLFGNSILTWGTVLPYNPGKWNYGSPAQ